MVTAGQISRNAYSLWLNDLDANRGSILFGGVDKEQYLGDLQTLPIQDNKGVYSEFLITLTSLGLGDRAIASNQALAVLLDSGSSLTYLPNNMVQEIYNQVGAQYEESQGGAYVPCALAEDKRTLDFTFSSPTIRVEMNELVLDLWTPTGQRLRFTDGSPACLFGVLPAGQGTNVLGDTFLRSAYVVYDMDNHEISLAPTNFNATGSDPVELPSGTEGPPGATVVANPVRATAGVIRGGGTVNMDEDVDGGAAGVAASALVLLLSSGFAVFFMLL